MVDSSSSSSSASWLLHEELEADAVGIVEGDCVGVTVVAYRAVLDAKFVQPAGPSLERINVGHGEREVVQTRRSGVECP